MASVLPSRRMWPFTHPERKNNNHMLRKFIAGAVIGGAIASIIGKHLLEKHENGDDDEKD